MKISLAWLNTYLQPGDASADDAQRALIDAGFPIESRENLPGGDVVLDVEITSNRGDCISHLGLAREVAAKTGRRVVLPRFNDPAPAGGPIASHLSLENSLHDVCPLFTARVIRGVNVGPSPAWLAKAVESVGQRSISNVVDVTNFINSEFGNPCHVFDLKKLAGGALVVRWAKDGEALTTLDGKKRVLKRDELVVADASRAQSLAGIIGGADSEVDASTTDVVFEMATWDPVTVRRAARRLQIRTDAGHRFERTVDARTIDLAARRAVAMLVEVAGGSVCDGVLSRGRPMPDLRQIRLRPTRVHAIMGIRLSTEEMVSHLRSVGVEVEPIGRSGEELCCTVPAWRPDLLREIDLIEEIARLKGLDAIPIRDTLAVRVTRPQTNELAMREIGAVLTGLGFFETVTFSFVGREQAKPFLVAGVDAVEVDDERRGEEPTLRPSLVPSLLACRRVNHEGGARVDGGVRLFETAAIFGQVRGVAGATPASVERRHLGLLMDVTPAAGGKVGLEEKQSAVRAMRGAVECVCRATLGPHMVVEVEPVAPAQPAYDQGCHAAVRVDRAILGVIGLISASTQAQYGLETPVVAAELNLEGLIGRSASAVRVVPLPAFPSIERDLSLIVSDDVPWASIQGVFDAAGAKWLENVAFVGAYRGKPIAAGKKSVTVRLRFRDESRTLRHEEIDPQVAAVVEAVRRAVGAELRTG